jgi:hypothetical protein
MPEPREIEDVRRTRQMIQPDHGDQTIEDHEYPVLDVHAATAEAMRFVMESTFDMSAWDLPRIKVPTGGVTTWQWMTPNGPVAAEHISGILIYFKEGRDFWPEVYGQGDAGNVPPSCSSIDGRVGVGNPGGPCNVCPWNQWGSRKTIDPSNPDSQAKACRHTARLFIAQPNQTIPCLVIAPPTSLKPIRRYAMGLAGMGYFYFGVESYLGLTPITAGRYTVAQINPLKGRVLNPAQLDRARDMLVSFAGMFANVRPTLNEAGSL